MNSGWPIVVIHLPEGQLSWHMPPDLIPYDSHSTEENYRRIDEFVRQFKGI